MTFHGPMVTKDFAHADGVDLASWEAALSGVRGVGDGGTAIRRPRRLVGGRLAKEFCMAAAFRMLVASLGTPYEIRTAGTILLSRTLRPSRIRSIAC